MVAQCWSYASYPKSLTSPQHLFSPIFYSKTKTHFRYNHSFPVLKTPKFTCSSQLGLQQIAEIAQNKVLVAAGVSAAIGQLSKPFTALFLYDNEFDLKIAFQAGGLPSTHSSAVVATATCLALERGFSDSIFGLSLVYAGLIMYDAQGVRREVGKHAKVLNKVVSKTRRDDLVDPQQPNSFKSSSKEGMPFVQKSTNSPLLLQPENETSQLMTMSSSPNEQEEEEEETMEPSNGSASLKESIGHTELEVIAGAVLGFFVSLAVNANL